MTKSSKVAVARKALSEADVDAFRAASAAFNRKATRTQATALKALHALGTHTKAGKLIEKYR